MPLQTHCQAQMLWAQPKPVPSLLPSLCLLLSAALASGTSKRSFFCLRLCVCLHNPEWDPTPCTQRTPGCSLRAQGLHQWGPPSSLITQAGLRPLLQHISSCKLTASSEILLMCHTESELITKGIKIAPTSSSIRIPQLLTQKAKPEPCIVPFFRSVTG